MDVSGLVKKIELENDRGCHIGVAKSKRVIGYVSLYAWVMSQKINKSPLIMNFKEVFNDAIVTLETNENGEIICHTQEEWDDWD